MDNPLLEKTHLPPFDRILPEHIEPALDHILTHNRNTIAKLLEKNETVTWESTFAPIEELNDHLHSMFSPVSHLYAVMNTPELREIYNRCITKLTDYNTWLSQNETLFKVTQTLSKNTTALNKAQRKVVNNTLRDFHLSGVNLPLTKKQRYAELQQILAKLTTQYADNVLDSTQAWEHHITDESLLDGLPQHAVQEAKEAAIAKGKSGWLLSLEYPCYHAVVTYSTHASLRQKIHTAYVTRASDQGPNAGQWDNTEVMYQILKCRHELAHLLGFNSYAELSLATKMAKSPTQVLAFLNDLATRSREKALHELGELQAFAHEEYGIDNLETWDIAYYSEKLKTQKFALSQEELRPYFPEDKVLSGLFSTVEKLFDIHVKEEKGIKTWHKDVRFFSIFDANQQLCGQLYLDLYSRKNKQGGAWMDECRSRRVSEQGKIQIPVAYLTCNLAKPTSDMPALFNHDEVVTLFHEFGHCLHHLLTKVDYADVSGINGVEWDVVEFPSQLMEQWCWQKESLALISSHYQTGESLPDSMVEKLHQTRTYQAAMQMLRQIEFSLFDFKLHHQFNPKENQSQIQSLLDHVREQTAVIIPPPYNRFQHSFSHIFAGGYAAGYYSYKWAEVLSSDAFSLFEEKGIFDTVTGKLLLKNVLEVGGVPESLDMFIAFRGREPKFDALLREHGIE